VKLHLLALLITPCIILGTETRIPAARLRRTKRLKKHFEQTPTESEKITPKQSRWLQMQRPKPPQQHTPKPTSIAEPQEPPSSVRGYVRLMPNKIIHSAQKGTDEGILVNEHGQHLEVIIKHRAPQKYERVREFYLGPFYDDTSKSIKYAYISE